MLQLLVVQRRTGGGNGSSSSGAAQLRHGDQLGTKRRGGGGCGVDDGTQVGLGRVTRDRVGNGGGGPGEGRYEIFIGPDKKIIIPKISAKKILKKWNPKK